MGGTAKGSQDSNAGFFIALAEMALPFQSPAFPPTSPLQSGVNDVISLPFHLVTASCPFHFKKQIQALF